MRSHVASSRAAASGARATARARCSCMPKSAATAAIHPSVEPSENSAELGRRERRAAATVTMNSDCLRGQVGGGLQARRAQPRVISAF